MTTMELLLLILNGVILPLCAWTLYSVHTLTKGLAVEAVYGQRQSADILELRARVTSCEAQVVELRIKLEGRTHHGR